MTDIQYYDINEEEKWKANDIDRRNDQSVVMTMWQNNDESINEMMKYWYWPIVMIVLMIVIWKPIMENEESNEMKWQW